MKNNCFILSTHSDFIRFY